MTTSSHSLPRVAAIHGRLSFGHAMTEAVRLWPMMMTGAGGALILSALLWGVGGVGGVTGGAAVALQAAGWLAGLVGWSAATRIGVAGDLAGAKAAGLGPFGFQLGRPELRLAGAFLLLLLFFAIILSLLGLTALALFGAAGLDVEALKLRDWAAVGPAWKLALLAVIGVVLIGAPVVLAVRVSLFAQATIARNRMTSLGVTGLTNGAMAPLFAGLAVSWLPGLAWLALCLALGLDGRLATIGWLVLHAAWQAPISAGFLGAAWRRLERPEEELAPL